VLIRNILSGFQGIGQEQTTMVLIFVLLGFGAHGKLNTLRILASLVLDSTGFWARISARTLILRNITTGGNITGGFFPGASFPSYHRSIYRVSEDNFRGSACVSEWMLISV
jgi:formate/nitrite transporter FocA (FNT family)